MSGIVLEAVRKVFADDIVAVDDISLEIGEGEFMILVGPSGCGKSTTLRMVAGLEEMSGGRVWIGGVDVTSLPPRKRDIAMVFQSYALYAHMSVRDNIGFGLKMAKTSKAEVTRRVEAAAAILGIEELLVRKPRQLSGGQRQRVAMGRAIVREPAAFLMDEPLSNLDAKLRVEMRGEITSLQQRTATPTLYVTHDQTEAMTMGDRVAVLRAGVLEQLGTPAELYARPANMFVASFIGSPAMNLIEGRCEVEDSQPWIRVGPSRLAVPPRLAAANGRLASYAGRSVTIGIRPEDFVGLATVGTDAALDVTVSRVESLGSEVFAYFQPVESARAVEETSQAPIEESPEAARHACTARLPRDAEIEAGDRVSLDVDCERLFFFDPDGGEVIA